MRRGNTEAFIAWQPAVDAVAAACDPQRVVLFGSVARGEATAESDIDLLIVQPRERWREATRGRELLRLRKAMPRVAVDLLLYTPEEVADRAGARNTVVARALREGRVVYERP